MWESHFNIITQKEVGMQITVNNEKIINFKEKVSLLDIAKSISDVYAKSILFAKVDGIAKDLSSEITQNCKVEFFDFSSDKGKQVYWHSTAHLMAQAVKELFPEVKVTIGPAIENGFYYDFEREESFTKKELLQIEKRMKKLSKKCFKYSRREISKVDAIEYFKEKGEKYKVEIINEIPQDQIITLYTQGDFTDLCKGPHLSNTGKIKAIKLTKTSGAYWRGNEKNIMLKRIYGISFPNKQMLADFLKREKEAKRRDHRLLGKVHDLFSVSDEVGSGLILWHPKGAVIRSIIEDFWKKEHIGAGYSLIYTPHIGRAELWKTSGHLGFFNESMYPPLDIEGNDYYLKPMNCPFHIEIFNNSKKSYRDLPIRYAELGTVYRYERSGTLHGLMRVRGFTQDDAHIICSLDQIDIEIEKVIDFSLKILSAFGFTDLEVFLSTKPDKFVGKEDEWFKAEESLSKALKSRNIFYMIDEGGGAFYGPKIDIKIKDAIGRSWQCSTIQFDFNLPERFNMKYVTPDNSLKKPFMVHRALMGSLERFFGILVEHFAADFPLWLNPLQISVIPVSIQTIKYSSQVAKKLDRYGFRTSLDDRDEKVGYKIRDGELKKVSYMLILGPKEEKTGTVSVRKRHLGDLGQMKIETFIERLQKEIKEKR